MDADSLPRNIETGDLIMGKASAAERVLAGVGAALGWLALGLQLRLAIGFCSLAAFPWRMGSSSISASSPY
jgi:hypothetical protein